MPEIRDETCRNCGEVLFQTKIEDTGETTMVDPGVWPESDGETKFFRCPACDGRNMTALNEENGRYWELLGFLRR